MKKAMILFLAATCIVAIGIIRQGPGIEPGTETTATGVVMDRAMASNTPYLSIEYSDGSGVCLWDPTENKIPNDVHVGDEVTVTYGKESGKDRYILLEIQ